MSENDGDRDWKQGCQGCLILLAIGAVVGLIGNLVESPEEESNSNQSSASQQQTSVSDETSDKNTETAQDESKDGKFRIRARVLPWYSAGSEGPYLEAILSQKEDASENESASEDYTVEIPGTEYGWILQHNFNLPSLSGQKTFNLKVTDTEGINVTFVDINFPIDPSKKRNWFTEKHLVGYVTSASEPPLPRKEFEAKVFSKVLEDQTLRGHFKETSLEELKKAQLSKTVFIQSFQKGLKAHNWDLAYKSLVLLQHSGTDLSKRLSNLHKEALAHLTSDKLTSKPESCIEEIEGFHDSKHAFLKKLDISSKDSASDSKVNLSEKDLAQLTTTQSQCRIAHWKQNDLLKSRGRWVETPVSKHKVYNPRTLSRIVNPRQQGLHSKKVYEPKKDHNLLMVPVSIHNEQNELLSISLTGGVSDHDYNLFNVKSGYRKGSHKASSLAEAYYWKHYPRFFDKSGMFAEFIELQTGKTHKARLFYEIPDDSSLEQWFLQIQYTVDASNTDGPSSVERAIYVPLD